MSLLLCTFERLRRCWAMAAFLPCPFLLLLACLPALCCFLLFLPACQGGPLNTCFLSSPSRGAAGRDQSICVIVLRLSLALAVLGLLTGSPRVFFPFVCRLDEDCLPLWRTLNSFSRPCWMRVNILPWMSERQSLFASLASFLLFCRSACPWPRSLSALTLPPSFSPPFAALCVTPCLGVLYCCV